MISPTTNIKTLTNSFIIICTLFFSVHHAYSQDTVAGEKLKKSLAFEGLGSVWGMDFIDNDRALATVKKGKLFLLNLKDKSKKEISGLPKIKFGGQGGLLDVKVSPQFEKNNEVYITYSKVVGNYKTTALALGNLVNNQLTNVKDIFVAKTDSNKGVHYGSRITFDDKYLYVSIGERGLRDRAQLLDYHNGKIIRLNLDGSVPKSNPFVGVEKALPEIYSYGHRNPQGLFYDFNTKTLWSGEHGPRGGDEINKVEAGKNYGWPVITYGSEYWGPSIGTTHREGMEQPSYYYVPSIAPCGLMAYSGKLFTGLKGALFQGALKLQHLNVLTPNGDKYKETRLYQDIGRVRSVVERPNGEILFSTDSGQIYQLKKG